MTAPGQPHFAAHSDIQSERFFNRREHAGPASADGIENKLITRAATGRTERMVGDLNLQSQFMRRGKSGSLQTNVVGNERTSQRL